MVSTDRRDFYQELICADGKRIKGDASSVIANVGPGTIDLPPVTLPVHTMPVTLCLPGVLLFGEALLRKNLNKHCTAGVAHSVCKVAKLDMIHFHECKDLEQTEFLMAGGWHHHLATHSLFTS